MPTFLNLNTCEHMFTKSYQLIAEIFVSRQNRAVVIDKVNRFNYSNIEFADKSQKMPVKFDLIAAACENMGIGINGDLPWRLRKEMAFFTRMTSETADPNKKNVVLMGRRTWECIPNKFKPLQNRINFVLSRSKQDLSSYQDVYGFTSLEEVIAKLESDAFRSQFENVWVIGGSHIYKETMESKYFHRLYLTKVLATFECDTFFPKLKDNLQKVSDPRVPEEVEEEKGIKFVYNIYENPDYNKDCF